MVGDDLYLNGTKIDEQAAALLIEAEWELGLGPPSQPWRRNPFWRRALSVEEIKLVAAVLP